MAADRAKMLCRPDNPWTLVIMLGVRVADAFSEVTRVSVAPLEASCAFGSSGIRFVNLPHPSGRNLAWNDRKKISAARSLLARLRPGVPWGELDGDRRWLGR
jgi:uracil-DNA glycosylase